VGGGDVYNYAVDGIIIMILIIIITIIFEVIIIIINISLLYTSIYK